MPFFQTSLGIDLRQDRIAIAHLRKTFNRVWVEDSVVIPLGEEKTKEERELEIINAMQGAIGSLNLSIENVILGLPREKTVVKLIEMPSATKENLKKVLEYELVKYVPLPLEETIFDFQTLDEKGGLLRIMLVAMKKGDLLEYVDLFKRMGIQPAAIEISSTASANLFYYDQHPVDPAPVALLGIDKGFFEFNFFDQGNLKETFHQPFLNRNERAAELVAAYRLALLRGLGEKNGSRFFVFGDEANETLVERLKQEISPQMTLARSFKKVRMGNGLRNIAECYGSIGLALRGLAKTRWAINLLPPNLRKEVSRRGLYLAVFLSVASLVLAGVWTIHPFLKEREGLRQITMELAEKRPKVEAIEAIQKKRELLEKEVREFESLRGEEISRPEILKELSDIIPPTVWIWSLRLQSQDLEINGFANSASDLIAILDKSPLFQEVEFSSPVTKERRLFGEQVEKERFRISAKIERTK
jgi:general secretion pathway protein L